jgi:hypothetical protein
MVEFVQQKSEAVFLLLMLSEIYERGEMLHDITGLIPDRADEDGGPKHAAILARANPRGLVQSLAQRPHLGPTCPRQNDADRVKHDQLRVPLHFLRHLLERRLSDKTSESFDLLRHLRFSLGNCETS